MIRLNLFNKNYIYYEKNEYYIASDKAALNIPTKDLLNKTEAQLLSEPAVKSYDAFLNKIENITEKYISGSYITFLIGKELFVFLNVGELNNARISNENILIKLIVRYEIENDGILEFVKKLYKFTDTKFYQVSISNTKNNFSYLVSIDILRVLFAKANIEGTGRILYEQHSKAKKDGGRRIYYAPDPELKSALANLNHLFQKVYDKKNADFQVAYKKGKSIKDGALLHVNHKYVFNIDFKNFYPSCKRELVVKYIDFLFDYSFNRDFIEEEFLKTILIDDGLFIGNPCSGTLANAVIAGPVLYMKYMVKKYGMALSVYADDISFSSDKFISEKFVKDIFTEAFTKYGLIDYFTLKEEKSVGFSGANRKVTGVSINDSNKVTIPRKYYRILRAMLDHLGKGDSVDIRLLKGKLAYATEIDDHGKVYNLLTKYSNLVEQYNLCSQETMAEMAKRANLTTK